MLHMSIQSFFAYNLVSYPYIYVNLPNGRNNNVTHIDILPYLSIKCKQRIKYKK